MLFIESPVGVGFSYSNTTSDYNNLGDKFTREFQNKIVKKYYKSANSSSQSSSFDSDSKTSSISYSD